MKELFALVEQTKKGDARAQHILFDLYKNRWMGICVRYVKDSDEAKDVFQESAIRIFRDICELKNIEAFEGWARRIVIHHSLNYLKKRKVYVLTIQEYGEHIPRIEQGDAVALESMAMAEVLYLINQLPEGYRLVVNLVLVDGYKHTEVAGILNISEGTSRSQLNKARKFLQKLIEEQKIKEDARIAG